MLNYNHVHYFHVAATEGSVARAAERLGVTQPTVSEQIKLLEKSLETQLFERTGTGLRLTAIGRAVYAHTTAMFRSSDRIIELVGKSPPDQLVSLRIGISAAVSRSIAADFLTPVLSLKECLPTVQTGDFPHLLHALRRREIDLLLAETAPPENGRDGLQVADLHQPRLVVVAGTQTEVRDDWAAVSLIQYGITSAYRWEVENYLTERQLRPVVSAETDDTLLMLEAAARTACIAFVPKSIARDAIATGRVRVVDTLATGTANVHALYHDAASAEMARRAVALLVEYAVSLDS